MRRSAGGGNCLRAIDSSSSMPGDCLTAEISPCCQPPKAVPTA